MCACLPFELSKVKRGLLLDLIVYKRHALEIYSEFIPAIWKILIKSSNTCNYQIYPLTPILKADLLEGGPRGRVVKVANFSALDHSIISPMRVRASHGARIHM